MMDRRLSWPISTVDLFRMDHTVWFTSAHTKTSLFSILSFTECKQILENPGKLGFPSNTACIMPRKISNKGSILADNLLSSKLQPRKNQTEPNRIKKHVWNHYI